MYNSKKTKYAKDIKKTCLYNFVTLKPHFYIVKLGFTRVYIIFLISAQKHRLWIPEHISMNKQTIVDFFFFFFFFFKFHNRV